MAADAPEPAPPVAVDHPVTPAVRALRDAGVPFEPHLFEYVEKGGTRWSSAALGVDEHCVIKTIVLLADGKKPLVVLMHGDKSISTKTLARALGVKVVAPADPDEAHRLTGYLVGGTSPLGMKRDLPVYVEPSVLELPRLYINGGKRGFLVALTPADLQRAVTLTPVACATEKTP